MTDSNDEELRTMKIGVTDLNLIGEAAEQRVNTDTDPAIIEELAKTYASKCQELGAFPEEVVASLSLLCTILMHQTNVELDDLFKRIAMSAAYSRQINSSGGSA